MSLGRQIGFSMQVKLKVEAARQLAAAKKLERGE